MSHEPNCDFWDPNFWKEGFWKDDFWKECFHAPIVPPTQTQEFCLQLNINPEFCLKAQFNIPLGGFDISKTFEPNPTKEVYIEPQNNNPVGAWASLDGTKVYTSRSSQEFIWQWNLSTPFNLGTAVYNQQIAYDGAGGAQDFRCWSWNSDGTKLWIIQNSGDIYAYSLSVGWDISTLTIDGDTYDLDADMGFSGAAAIGNGAFFKDDGTELYVLWSGHIADEGTIGTWTLSVPWDITTLVFDSHIGYIWGDEFPQVPFSGHMMPDGKHWVLSDLGSNHFWQYTMSTPYDHSTLDYSGHKFDHGTYLPSFTGSLQGFYIHPNQENIYMIESSANDNYFQAEIL